MIKSVVSLINNFTRYVILWLGLEDGIPHWLPLLRVEMHHAFRLCLRNNTEKKKRPKSNNKLSKSKSLKWAKPKLSSSLLRETGTSSLPRWPWRSMLRPSRTLKTNLNNKGSELIYFQTSQKQIDGSPLIIRQMILIIYHNQSINLYYHYLINSFIHHHWLQK